jgi:cyclic lactone autoinducer peptide
MKLIQKFMAGFGKYFASASLSLAVISSFGVCHYVLNQPKEPAELAALASERFKHYN